MKFRDRIQNEKLEILKEWYQTVIDSFPQKSRRLISINEDRFENPMGYTLYEGMQQILEVVVNESSLDHLDEALGKIIKVKAIQENSVHEGIAFLFDLKMVIRRHCDVISEQFLENEELFATEDLIDSIVLKAHKLFVESREKISELKVKEAERKTHMLSRLVGGV